MLELAQEYAIPHVRLTQTDWLAPFGGSALMRNTLIQAMQTVNRPRFIAQTQAKSPIFLGLSRSGKLDYAYLATLFSRFKPGEYYELMCHPGRFNPSEIPDLKIRAYHDWEAELALLQSPHIKALYEKFGIRLSRY
ncbi:MAG: ChbG/HpnK family deacetylase [Methylococcaceae bacterium]|nr:ChbG/HpnK family deacetylase [Methylococcaceae bacterium]